MIFMGLSANKSVYQVVREAADRVRGISVTPINPGVTVTPIHGGMTVTPLSGLGLDYGYTRGMFGGPQLRDTDPNVMSGLTVLGILGVGALILAFVTHEPPRRRYRRR